MTKGQRTISLIILSCIAGLVYLTPFMRFSFYDQMREALQLTDVQLGTIGGIYGLFNVISYVPTGWFAEKCNTKLMLIISMIGMASVTIWYSMYPGYSAYLVIHAFYGIFSVGTFWSPYLKAIRALGTPETQGTIYGLSEGLRGVAQTIVSFLCIGVISASINYSVGFRYSLYINAAAFILLGLLVFFLVPDLDKYLTADDNKPEEKENEKVKQTSNIILDNPMVKCLRSPSTWICIFTIMGGYACWNTVNGYMGTYCTRILEIPANVSSALSIIRSYIIVFLAGFIGGPVMDRFKTKGAGLFVAYAMVGVGAILTYLTHSVMLLCVVITVFLAFVVNIVKATYWSILGDAGISAAETGMATAMISLIGLTPDFFVSPIVSRFLAWGEAHGSLESGFNLMFVWLAFWAVEGMVAAFILNKKANKLKAK